MDVAADFAAALEIPSASPDRLAAIPTAAARLYTSPAW
jgi:hypothetical protein